MEEKPLISVCIVTYQHKDYIGKCLDSILSQKGNFSLEILLHDDASTDGSQEIIRSYQEKYPEIIFPILQTENQYSQGKRNITGIFNFPRVRGEFITVIDGDDFYLQEDKLEKQMEALQREEEAVLCFHPAKVLLPDGREGPKDLLRPYSEGKILEGRELINHPKGIAFSSMFFRRSLIERLPDFYYACPVGDRPIELMAALAGKAVYLPEEYTAYRFHLQSSWTEREKGRQQQEKYLLEMKHCYKLFLEAAKGKYSLEVEEAINRLSFSIALNLRDFDRIYQEEYRAYLQEMSFSERTLLRLEQYCPKIYRFLQKQFGMERKK